MLDSLGIAAAIVNNILEIIKEERDPDEQRKRMLMSLSKEMQAYKKQEAQLSSNLAVECSKEESDPNKIRDYIIERDNCVYKIAELKEALALFKEVK